MAFRVALVTPFSWSQPHDVNEHVSGLAAELRVRGHHVTILAPSNRARDLAGGRRALAGGLDDADVVALGPAVPISRRSRMGVPVGVRANLAVALAGGRFDVVHGFEPGLPSLSYLALRHAAALTVATFFSEERLRTRRAARNASGCSAGSMRCSRRARRRRRRRPSAFPAGTRSCRSASTSRPTHPGRNERRSSSNGGRPSGRSSGRSRASSPLYPAGSSSSSAPVH